MKRVAVLCGVGLLALIVGCSKSGDKLIRLTEVPEIVSTALDPYVTLGDKTISDDRIWVIAKGKAKQPLGERLQLNVQRFTAAGPLDQVTAFVVLANPPVVEPPPRPGDTEGAGGAPGPDYVPPPPPKIVADDEISITIDATSDKGKITKVVLTPVIQMQERGPGF
ncbi:MAG: hypothetical protein V2A58_08525 [Planctomycetota bacterium]